MQYQDSLMDIFRAEYRCPISKQPMATPVVAFDGISYEEQYILDWFDNHDVFPESIQKIASQEVFENVTLNCLINRVQIEVPKIVFTLKQLKDSIKSLTIQNQSLKNHLHNSQPQAYNFSDKPQSLILMTSLKQEPIISQGNYFDQKLEEPKRSSRIKQKLNQKDSYNDPRENQDYNRKQIASHLSKTKSIKKNKNNKPKFVNPIKSEQIQNTGNLCDNLQTYKPKSQIPKTNQEQLYENKDKVSALMLSEIFKLKDEMKSNRKVIENLQKQKEQSLLNIEFLSQEIYQLKEKIIHLRFLKLELQNLKIQNEDIQQNNQQLKYLNEQLIQQINQIHAEDIKNQFQLSKMTKQRDGYQKQRDQLLRKNQNHHMTWMFIFSTYEEAIFSYVKESNLKEQILQEEHKKLLNIKSIPQKPHSTEIQIGFYSDQSDSFIPPVKKTLKIANPKVTKAIQNLEKQYQNGLEKQQKQIEMISEIDEQRIKDNKLKQQITSRIQLFEIILSSKLKQNPDIDPKAVKQVKNFYKKISLLTKALPDQTPWNLWKAYKFHTFQTKNQKNNIKYGYQIDLSVWLKILKNFNEKSFDWKEVKFIKSHNSGINDASWKYLVKHAHLMPGLTEIDLEGNQITKVTQKDLVGWKNLFRLNLDRNPLNQQSLSIVKQFSNKSAMV